MNFSPELFGELAQHLRAYLGADIRSLRVTSDLTKKLSEITSTSGKAPYFNAGMRALREAAISCENI